MTPSPSDMSDPTAEGLGREIQSILLSLKGIVSITMGLALTNTVVVLITHGTYIDTVKLSSLKGWPILCSVAVIGGIIRFYHGNNRFIDSNYSPDRPLRPHRRGPSGLGVDFLVIFTQSVLFAVISFYASPRRELLLLFDALLVFDIFWYLATAQVDRDPKAQKYHRRWMQNNVGFGFLILVSYFEYLQHKHAAGWLDVGVALIMLNTCVDFVISRELYFGTRASMTVDVTSSAA